MTAAARFKQADLKRALKAAADAGQLVESFEITPNGEIRVVLAHRVGGKPRRPNSWDTVL